MRLLLPSLALAALSLAPTLAQASPFAIPLSSADLLNGPPAKAADGSSTEAPGMDDSAAPADEAAPGEGEGEVEAAPEGEEAAPEGEEAADEIGDPTEGEVMEDDEEEILLGEKMPKRGDFNANAIGIKGGLHLAPSYFLNAALASYSNAMCRDEIGGWGEKNGLVRVDGCNYYIGGEYVRRVNRAFDVGVGVGYLHLQLPDSLWIDNNEWDRDSCTTDMGGDSNCNLGAADYTEIDLRMVTVEVNFTGRGTLYRNADVEIQLGGGGGVGAGILVGNGVRRTPLGPNPGSPGDPNSCQTLEDLADFTKCTPRYYDDPDIDQANDGGPADISRDEVDMNGGMAPAGQISTDSSFARCSQFKCDGSDLDAFGAVETGGTWPVYPLVNIFGSFRIIIKDTFGISIEGGFKDGFFFGGGAHFFFGGGGADREKDKAKFKG